MHRKKPGIGFAHQSIEVSIGLQGEQTEGNYIKDPVEMCLNKFWILI